MVTVANPLTKLDLRLVFVWVDWVEVLHPVMHASFYMRSSCEGYEVGCLWILLLLKSKTGGDKRYENHRHKCAIIMRGNVFIFVAWQAVKFGAICDCFWEINHSSFTNGMESL